MVVSCLAGYYGIGGDWLSDLPAAYRTIASRSASADGGSSAGAATLPVLLPSSECRAAGFGVTVTGAPPRFSLPP